MKNLIIVLSLLLINSLALAALVPVRNGLSIDPSWQSREIVSHYQIPPHPAMAMQGQNNMHSDSYITDTYAQNGPSVSPLQTKLYQYRNITPGQCAGQNFDSEGNIYTVCIGPFTSHLKLLEKNTLNELASFEIPARKGTWMAILHGRAQSILEDSSGGAYFYLNHLNQAVVATANREIWIIGQKNPAAAQKELVLVKKIDLTRLVPSQNCPSLGKPEYHHPNCDKVTTALPDFNHNIWFITRFGRIGIVPSTLNPPTNVLELVSDNRREEIQNSFAVGKDAVYIVSDRALYRLEKGPNGRPQIIWRHAYDYGHQRRPGMISQGSGTTPTLLGDDYVAITDNAFPQMKVLVLSTKKDLPENERLICETEAFTISNAGTENSLIGVNHSLIVENNYGYIGPMGRNENVIGGISRIDFDPVTKICSRVWENLEVSSPTPVPKLSLANGLIYLYTRENKNSEARDQKWFLSTLNFHNGNLVSSHYIGTGHKYNNNWSAIALAPLRRGQRTADVFVGTFYGLIKISP